MTKAPWGIFPFCRSHSFKWVLFRANLRNCSSDVLPKSSGSITTAEKDLILQFEISMFEHWLQTILGDFKVLGMARINRGNPSIMELEEEAHCFTAAKSCVNKSGIYTCSFSIHISMYLEGVRGNVEECGLHFGYSWGTSTGRWYVSLVFHWCRSHTVQPCNHRRTLHSSVRSFNWQENCSLLVYHSKGLLLEVISTFLSLKCLNESFTKQSFFGLFVFCVNSLGGLYSIFRQKLHFRMALEVFRLW